jgi:fluoride ion exporter CrcB/FEX
MKEIELVMLPVGATTGVFLRHELVESSVALDGLQISLLTLNVLGSFLFPVRLAFCLGTRINLDVKFIVSVSVNKPLIIEVVDEHA